MQHRTETNRANRQQFPAAAAGRHNWYYEQRADQRGVDTAAHGDKARRWRTIRSLVRSWPRSQPRTPARARTSTTEASFGSEPLKASLSEKFYDVVFNHIE